MSRRASCTSSSFTGNYEAMQSVMTPALAIGANALVFAVFNVFVVHPLDLPQAQSLYTLERGQDKATFQSYPDYLDLRERNADRRSAAGDVSADRAIAVDGNVSRRALEP
jgi:hypothetical protein